MAISDEAKLKAVAEHYKETCELVSKQIGIRDRFFFLALVLLGLQLFQFSAPDESSKALIEFFKEHLGFQLTVSKFSLSALLWFALLAIVVRYFQANVYINRQYRYLHGLEGAFERLLGEKLFVREGHHYLSDYPYFSNWTHLLYTWVFPGLLVLVNTAKIIGDWPGRSNLGLPYILSCTFFLMVTISTVLHLEFLLSLRKGKSAFQYLIRLVK